MDHQEAIETLQDIHDVAEIRIENGDTRGVVYIPQDKLDGLKTAISAMQELQEYHKTGMTPAEIIRMQHGYAVKMTDLEDYQQLGTLEEVREAVEKQKKKKPRASNRCYVCPRCGLVTSLKIKHNYCDACGQHINWREEESPEPYHPDKCHGCFGAANNDCERCMDE